MKMRRYIRRKVYGLIQRFIHAWIGLTVIALLALGWIGKLINDPAITVYLVKIHIYCGYGLTVGFVARVIWGLIGPRHAKFSELILKIRSIPRNISSEKEHDSFGHNSVASMVYIGIYLAIMIAVITGLVLAGIQRNMGPFASIFFDDFRWHEIILKVHEIGLFVLTTATIGHIFGLIRHEKTEEIPVSQAMLSGYQYRLVKEEENKNE